MKRYLYPALVFFSAILLLSCGRSEEDRAVDELVREASELVKLAERERERKVTEAEYLEREALERLEQAVALYPASPRTTRLREGKTRIGPYTFSEFQEKVAAQDQARASSGQSEEVDPLADILGQAGDLAGRPGPPYFQAGVLARLAAAYSRRGDIPLADEFFSRAISAAESVDTPYYKVLALSEMAGQYVLLDREEEAGELLLEARALAEAIEYPFFRSGAEAVIAARYLEMGAEEEALEIIETVEEPYYRAWILLKASGALIEAGKEDEARALFDQARTAAERIEDPVFRVEIITDLAARAARLDNPAAPELLNEAYVLAEALEDSASRAGALARLASCSAKLDRTDEAIDNLERAIAEAGTIEDNLFKDLVLMEIAECLAAMGDYDRVLEIVDLIEVPRFKALSLAALAQSCLDAREEETSIEFAGQAGEAALMVENPHFRADILIRIAGCLSPRLPVPILPEVAAAASAESATVPPTDEAAPAPPSD
ncbi:MAG: hypothetical protein P9M08_10085 [Candidatus Erginobacter occultus]|nr:hypothetical protein [Candidatus Erginobacter occultus]